jgi:hypothetical protein
MLATFAERGGRAFVGRAERVVEATHAAEASREGNFGERHLGAVDQALGCLDAARRRDLARRRAGVAQVAREKRPDEYDKDDGPAVASPVPLANEAARPWNPRKILRDPKFITISIPFALGLTAQVGFLTHQVAFLTP